MNKKELTKNVIKALSELEKLVMNEWAEAKNQRESNETLADAKRIRACQNKMNEILKRCKKDGEEPNTSTSTQEKSNGAEK